MAPIVGAVRPGCSQGLESSAWLQGWSSAACPETQRCLPKSKFSDKMYQNHFRRHPERCVGRSCSGEKMGFFSRFFKLREQHSVPAETTWAVEDNGSELLLDAEYTSMLVTEIDIDAAIASHEKWRLQLQDMVQGRSSEVMQSDLICQEDHCDLCHWLHGAGRALLGHYPAFDMLVQRHRYFHQQAAAAVSAFQANDRTRAVQLLNGGCRHASNQVLLLLKELKRGLGR